MHTSLFYFGLILIFISGMFYSPLVGIILTEFTSAMIDAVAPVLTISNTDMGESYTNSILQSVYGIPLLVIGLILVKKHRK